MNKSRGVHKKRERILPVVLSKLEVLKEILSGMGKVLVAFSGGVDSTLLLRIAIDVLGEGVLAVIASSDTYPAKEIERAEKLAQDFGVRHKVIHTLEMESPEFLRNPPQRCYYCKQELFSKLKEIASEEGIPYVLDGSNHDDLGDFRPGARAASEIGVRSPLREAGLGKDEIRTISLALGLPTWNKPSLACLASRFPYDTPIDRESLRKVGKAEDFLRGLGFSQVRVRHHGQTARIEVGVDDLKNAVKDKMRVKIIRKLKSLGYTYVTLDLAGYRTGSMNEPLKFEDGKALLEKNIPGKTRRK